MLTPLECLSCPKTLEIISKISDFGTAINYCHVSPDGKTLIAVGDSPEIYVLSIQENGEYKREPSLMFPAYHHESAVPMASTGCGFSVSWNDSGSMFAVAQQYPGKIAIWDSKEFKLLHLLSAMAHGNECRSVRFYEPDDCKTSFVIFSEKLDHVHIVDLQKQTRQIITLPYVAKRSLNSTQICGFAVSKSGRKLFIGRNTGIYQYDVIGVRTLKELCTRYINSTRSQWKQEYLVKKLPRDILECLLPGIDWTQKVSFNVT